MRFIVATVPGHGPGVERLLPSLYVREAGEAGVAEGGGGRSSARGRNARAQGARRGALEGAHGAARPEGRRAARAMGCGPSQAAAEQRRVPAPQKGWEEGFKVKTETNGRKVFYPVGLAIPTFGGGWSGVCGGSQRACLADVQWVGREGAAFFWGRLTAVLTRSRAATGLAFVFQEPAKVVAPQGRGRNNGRSAAFGTELGWWWFAGEGESSWEPPYNIGFRKVGPLRVP